MPFATTAAIVGAGLAGSLGGSAIASHGAGKAASTQASAATQAAQIQAQSAAQALQFQKQQYAQNQTQMAPWLSSGTSALANLDNLLGINTQPGAVQGGSQALPGGTPASSGPGVQSPLAVSNAQAGGGNQLTHPGMTPNPLASYAGQNFNQLTQSGDPAISPSQQTTQQWKAMGVPTQNITTSDGRTVTVRTDVANQPQAGYTPPQDLNSLVNPSLGARGSLSQGFNEQFQAPTGATEANDPGYAFRLQEGQKALQRSAAAKGGLLSGGTAKAEQQYGQDYASNEYGNVYNRALGEYQQRYNIFNQNQTNQYNRLASLAGVGQTTAQQLGSAGQNFANSAGNILQSSGNAQASGINNAAAANASAYQNSGNIWGSTLSNLGGGLSNLLLTQQYLKQQQQPPVTGV